MSDSRSPSGRQSDLPENITKVGQLETSESLDVLSRLSDGVTGLQLARYEEDIRDELLEASLEEYKLHLQQLDAAKAHLEKLLDTTASTLRVLIGLTSSLKDVESQTSTFQEKSEGLLAEQRQHEKIADGIRDGLRYYEPLDKITRRLNAPGVGALVRSQDFPGMLLQLDECIDYMQTHPQQKESQTYLARYRQLLTRALTLLRTQFVGLLRETTREVAQRIADKQLNDTTISSLLYAKFRLHASEMRALGIEIQKRTSLPVDAESEGESEYQSLMDELHTAFATCRARLMLPLVRTKLREIAQAPGTAKDLVASSRASISYIRGICLDEFELWAEWFHGQRGLYGLLESICEPLYDQLRPQIIHETKLYKLCQLCTLLQTRYMNDEEEDEDENTTIDLSELDFSALVRPLLEDTQSRIVFRAQSILRDEIERFTPKTSDLDYPARLKAPKATTSSRKTSQSNGHLRQISNSLDFTMPPKEHWSRTEVTARNSLTSPYPTLEKAVSLLSLIYRLLNPAVFNDLAHRIVHATTLSLLHASRLLRTAPKLQSPQLDDKFATVHQDPEADSLLFLLAHLMLLKSHIVAFDIEFYPYPETSFDFSNLTNTFYELHAERGGLFNPLNLVRLVGRGRDLLPRVVNNMLDAKAELDGQMRKAISEITAYESGKMTRALKSRGVITSPQKAAKAVAEVRKAVEQETPQLRARLQQWFMDEWTRKTLLMAVSEAIDQEYEDFLALLEGASQPKSKSKKAVVKGKGKGREDEVWDADTFVRWTQTVFAIDVKDDEADGKNDNDITSVSGALSPRSTLRSIP